MAERRIVVIGPGRAGGSLVAALKGTSWTVVEVRDRDSRRAIAACDVIVVATPDAAIAEVAAALDVIGQPVVMHLAGSLGLDVLPSRHRRAAVHPLMALPSAEVGSLRLRQNGWFAVSSDPEAAELAAELVAVLGGNSFAIHDDGRSLYHAAAVIASNHVVALLGHATRVGDEVGVPRAALAALTAGAVASAAELGPGAALTGPAARGDEETVERHLAVLRRVLPNEVPAYQAMLDEARRLAGANVPWRGHVEIFESIGELRHGLGVHRAAGRSVGFVPTMGFLHEGHQSLIEASVAANDVTVVSLFVNPLQFAAGEDFDSYPRDGARDQALCAAAGADIVFVPSVKEMYPDETPVATRVAVPSVAAGLEGASRPDHLAGVATVVAKLFSIVGPCRAYFGVKDWQQVAVVTTMVADLSIPVEVVLCPTRREPDGLAISSRNVYLTAQQRAQAPVLRAALDAGLALLRLGVTRPEVIESEMARVVATAPLAELDYAAARPASMLTLALGEELKGEVRLLLAVRFGPARLIDNDGTTTEPPPSL